MSDEEPQQQRFRPQLHLDRLREEAEKRRPGPDGKCVGTVHGDPKRGSSEVVSFAERTGHSTNVAVGQNIRVLLIEPDETLRNYLKDTLNHHGFDVTVADHPDGRGMYQPGVGTNVNGEFPLFNAIIWGEPRDAISKGIISASAPDPISAMMWDNRQGIPTVLVTDNLGVKQGIEGCIQNQKITYPVIVLDREKMDLMSTDGLRNARAEIESAARAGIARANALKHPSTGKGR